MWMNSLNKNNMLKIIFIFHSSPHYLITRNFMPEEQEEMKNTITKQKLTAAEFNGRHYISVQSEQP